MISVDNTCLTSLLVVSYKLLNNNLPCKFYINKIDYVICLISKNFLQYTALPDNILISNIQFYTAMVIVEQIVFISLVLLFTKILENHELIMKIKKFIKISVLIYV